MNGALCTWERAPAARPEQGGPSGRARRAACSLKAGSSPASRRPGARRTGHSHTLCPGKRKSASSTPCTKLNAFGE